MADYKRELDGGDLHMTYPPKNGWLVNQSPDLLHVHIGKHTTTIKASGNTLTGIAHFDTSRERIERLIAMLQEGLTQVDKFEEEKIKDLERELEERKNKKGE